jgi:hypothetical protein
MLRCGHVGSKGGFRFGTGDGYVVPAQAIIQLHPLLILHTLHSTTPPFTTFFLARIRGSDRTPNQLPRLRIHNCRYLQRTIISQTCRHSPLKLARGRCLGVRQNRDRHKHRPHCVEMTEFIVVLGEKTRVERGRRERLNVEAQQTSSRGGQRLRLDVSERIHEIADALTDVPPNDRKGNVLLTILGLCEQMQEGPREQSVRGRPNPRKCRLFWIE